jgi:hypothetical protein
MAQQIEAVLDAARAVASGRIAADAARVDSERLFPLASMKALGEAGRAVRDLIARMHRNRIRRLRAAGFDEKTAQALSDLHTPNLM